MDVEVQRKYRNNEMEGINYNIIFVNNDLKRNPKKKIVL